MTIRYINHIGEFKTNRSAEEQNNKRKKRLSLQLSAFSIAHLEEVNERNQRVCSFTSPIDPERGCLIVNTRNGSVMQRSVPTDSDQLFLGETIGDLN